MSKPRYLLLALVLWLGQAVLLVHAADLDVHSGADTCEICLHASPVSSALPVATLPAVAPQPDKAPRSDDDRNVDCARVVDTLVRGPPVFS